MKKYSKEAIISFNSIKGTFYGIETSFLAQEQQHQQVLIVPFMELKLILRLLLLLLMQS